MQISDSQATEIILLIVAVFMVLVPLGLLFLRHQQRWLVVLALNAVYITSYLFGGWPAVIAVVLASMLALLLSATTLRHIFDESTWKAFSSLFRESFGIASGFKVIEDGRIAVSSHDVPLLGPCTLIIRPGNAVIVGRGSMITRVCGPAVDQIESSEYIRSIYDLTQRQHRITLEDVLTSDLVPVYAEVMVSIAIDLDWATVYGMRSFGQTEVDTIMQIDRMSPDWETTTLIILERVIRESIGTLDSDSLMRPAAQEGIEQVVLETVKGRLRDSWRVRVDAVVFKNLQPRQDFIRRKLLLRTEEEENYARQRNFEHLVQSYILAKRQGVSEEFLRELLHIGVGDADEVVKRVSALGNRVAARLRLDRDFEDLSKENLDELIASIAEHVDIQPEDIEFSYAIPGSVIVVLEMPEEAARRFMDLFIYGDPVMGVFGITEIRISHSLPQPHDRGQPALPPPSGLELDYSHGLRALQGLVKTQPDEVRREFSTLEARLRDIQTDIRIYGVDADARSQRNQVIDSLNHLANRVQAGTSFTDLCTR